MDTCRPVDIRCAIKVNQTQVGTLPLVDADPERVSLHSSDLVCYGACPIVVLPSPETGVVLFFKGLVAAQSFFRGPSTPLVWLTF